MEKRRVWPFVQSMCVIAGCSAFAYSISRLPQMDASDGLPLALPTILEPNVSAFHLYVVRIQPARPAKTHRQIFDELR